MRELGYREERTSSSSGVWRKDNTSVSPNSRPKVVRLKVEVIVVSTPAGIGRRSRRRARSRSSWVTRPIRSGRDRDQSGRPGGRTGLASSLDDIVPKQIELLASAVPSLSRVGLLVNPGNPNTPPVLKSAQASARQVGFVLVPVEAQTPSELEAALVTLTKERVGAVIVIADAFFNSQRRRLVELALQARLPTMFGQREYAQEGGLMSYGESLFEFYRRAASYVDKIFKGANPADLPIEQPTLFKLVINRKTADALGVTIPPQLYIFADEVIE